MNKGRLLAMGLRLTGIGRSDGSSFAGGRRIAPDQVLRLGRGPYNDWILKHPHRHISKNHCAIAYRSGHLVVSDLSTNGVYIGDDLAPVGRGVSRMSQPLAYNCNRKSAAARRRWLSSFAAAFFEKMKRSRACLRAGNLGRKRTNEFYGSLGRAFARRRDTQPVLAVCRN